MYTDFYGFSERPFQLTPDARFYFDTRTHKKAMSYLGYGLAQGEGFIVITGDIGAGKSTLAGHLVATIDRARLNAISLVSTQVEGDDMLRLTAQGMGIATAGLAKAQLLERVEQWLADQAHAHKRTLLIVDESQNLSISALEELRMLSNFQLGGQALLQILLLGQPEFREKMASDSLEQLRQRVIATHHLDPMGPGEIEPYVTHRLRLVGWNGRPEFTPEAFDALYRHAAGVPRRVNQLASRLMLFGAVEQLETIGADTVAAVVADLAADGVAAEPERVLPLRSRSRARSEAPEPAATDSDLENRIAALEQRVSEQDIALRRVLSLLVRWVEQEQPAPSYRHNAA
ncbi:MAG: XrtA/PEP-CTERM system-associated ATPase [Sphingomonadales bacterium]